MHHCFLDQGQPVGLQEMPVVGVQRRPDERTVSVAGKERVVRVTRAGWRPGPGSLGGGWGGIPEAAAVGWRQASATVDEERAQHGDGATGGT